MKWLGSIRSILTFMLVLTACIGFLMGKITSESFTTMVMAAITFYFVTKKRDEGNDHP